MAISMAKLFPRVIVLIEPTKYSGRWSPVRVVLLYVRATRARSIVVVRRRKSAHGRIATDMCRDREGAERRGGKVTSADIA